MAEFAIPVIVSSVVIGFVIGRLIRDPSIAFVISGYAGMTVFVCMTLLLALRDRPLSDAGDWIWFVVFLGAWSVVAFFVGSTCAFATSAFRGARSGRRE